MDKYLVDRLVRNGEDFYSSTIDSLGYDRESGTLYVGFSPHETVYAYNDVEESTFDMLAYADSVGRFFAKYIKGTYTGSIVRDRVAKLRNAEGGHIDTGRYAVQWSAPDLGGAGHFKPEFQAVDEDDALTQFKTHMAAVFGEDMNYEIEAVIHYYK